MQYNFDFLSSRKFQAIVAVLVLSLLRSNGIIESSITDPIITFLFSFVGINLAVKLTDAIAS